MSKVMKWQYAGKADITLGKEVHINPLPKIALYVTISIIVIACTLIFVFRDYLYDMTINPQIKLKYVTKTDNGFSVDIPYQFDFTAEKFIDEVNTKEYDSFMNPEILEYTYTVDETVDTNTIGSYQVIYNSSNRANTQQLLLTVNVIDTVAPVARLQDPITHQELKKSVDGSYKPMYIVRNHVSTSQFYGANSWNAEDFVLDYSDNYSEVTITYPEKPDWSGNSIEARDLTYSFTDESGNKTDLVLPLYVVTLTDNQVAELEDGDVKLNEVDLANNITNNSDIDEKIQQIAQTTHDNNNDTNKPSGGGGGQDLPNSQVDYNNTDPDTSPWVDDDWRNTPTNDDGTHVGTNPRLTADSFTWSVSTDGPFTSAAFWNRARANLHYYDYSKNDAVTTGGAIIEYQIEGPGTYSLHWQTPDGTLSCDQTFTVIE